MSRYVVPLALAPALTALAWLLNVLVQTSTASGTPVSPLLPIVIGAVAVAWWLHANDAGAGRWLASIAGYVVVALIAEIAILGLLPAAT